MAGPYDLFDVAAEWLAACEAAVASAHGGPIERAYVSPGPPAFDCEQLTVHPGGPAQADTAPLAPPLAPAHRATTGAVYLVNLTATVLRCIPGVDDDGEAPTEAQLEEAARAVHGDVWAIWAHTLHGHRAGSLFAPTHRPLHLDPAFPPLPEGNLAGWQIPIRVLLAGYEP